MSGGTSTKLKIIRGNPGKRPLPGPEPKPKINSSAPLPPKHLSYRAKKEWRRLAEIHHPIGLLTEADLSQFELLCEMFSQYQQALGKLKKQGQVIANKAGFAIENPLSAISRKSYLAWYKLSKDFGLNPAERSKMAIPQKEDREELDNFLGKNG